MLHLFLLIADVQQTPNAVLARYVAAHGSPLKTEMRFGFGYNLTGSSSSCSLLVDGTRRTKLEVRLGDDHYTSSSTPPIAREVDTKLRMYDEYPSGAGYQRTSRLSKLYAAFPWWVMSKNLKLGGKAYTSLPAKTLFGTVCDGVQTTVSGPMGSTTYKIWIDQKGMVRQFTSVLSEMGQTSTQTWMVKSYQARPSFTNADFALSIPIGYVPYALSQPEPRMLVGGTFPMTGWNTRSGKSVNLQTIAAGKPLLVALVDREGPSNRALPTLAGLRGKLPVVVISSDGSQQAAGLVDGGSWKRAAPIWTPCFVLIKPSGSITKMWMGWDSSASSGFIKDVLSAASGKS